MRHPDQDDIVGFVLGGLEPDHERKVSAHVERCKTCAAEVRHFAPAVGVLAESVEQLEPPPQLREKLMQTVNREAEPPAEITRERPRRSWLAGVLTRPATGLAAIALAVAAIGGYLVANGGDDPQQSTTISAQSRLPRAGGSLVVANDEATLHVHGMPLLHGKSAVYQVWVNDGTEVRPSATFVPHADGTATAAVPEAADGATQIMVTRERGPHPSQPTLPVVLDAELN
jgi:anti-sigma-K factor RskA